MSAHIRVNLVGPSNLPSLTQSTLDIDLNQIRNGAQLRAYISKKLNHLSQDVIILHQDKIITDNDLINRNTIIDQDRLIIIVSKQNKQKNQEYQPLIVGGIDLSDIPELQHLLVPKKKVDMTNKIKRNEIATKDQYKEDRKYGKQALQLSEMGYSDIEKNIEMLELVNGNIEKALELLS